MISEKHKSSIQSEFDGKFCGDARHRFKVGDIGFLLELTPREAGVSRIELRDSPARAQWTLNDILYGLVSGGRVDVEALGVAKITEVTRNGRGRILTLWGPELDAALDDLGYPEIDRYVYDPEDDA